MQPVPMFVRFFSAIAGIPALCILTLFLCAAQATAQNSAQNPVYVLDNVVISANKIAAPANETTVSVEVVISEDMEALQVRSVTDALNTMPGVYALSPGGLGQLPRVFVRGTPYSHMTQLRFDDFPLLDASDPNSGFGMVMAGMPFAPGAFERIELLKSSQGSLYGSGAGGGVISLFPAGKWDTVSGGSFQASGGAWDTYSFSSQLSYGNGRFYFNFVPAYTKTNGYRGLWHDTLGFILNTGLRTSEKGSVELSMIGFENESANIDWQTPGYVNGKITPQKPDTTNRTSDYLMAGLTYTHEISDLWEIRLKTAYSWGHRDQDTTSTPMSNLLYNSRVMYLEMLNTITPCSWLTVMAGMDFDGQQMKTDVYAVTTNANSRMGAIFAKATAKFLADSLIFTGGGRYTYHDEFHGRTTFDAGASYKFPFGLRLYGNVASGYRTPSLYNLYGLMGNWMGGIDIIGNPDLKPETSLSYELGVEQSLWDNRVILRAAAFKTDFKNMIDMEYDQFWNPYPYENFWRARTQGVELSLDAFLHEMLRLNLAYAHAESEIKQQGQAWSKSNFMPGNRLLAAAFVYPLPGLTLSLAGRWQNHLRLPLGGGITEKAYFTLDAAANYEINQNWSIFAKVNNLLNKKYTDGGWHMPGINAYAGVQVKF